MNSINWVSVLLGIAYIFMIVFSVSVADGMFDDFDYSCFMLCLLWPVFWAAIIIYIFLRPVCKFGIRLGEKFRNKYGGDF